MKWPWLVGLGVVAGGGMLALLTKRPSKPKDYDIEEGEVETTEVGESAGLTFVGVPVSPVIIKASVFRIRAHRHSLLKVSSSRRGPVYSTDVGWLGPVVLHGHSIQGQYVKYIADRGHFSGWEGYTDGWSGSEINSKNYYTKKHVEFPPPMQSPSRRSSKDGKVYNLPSKVGGTGSYGGGWGHNSTWGDPVVEPFLGYLADMQTASNRWAKWSNWGFETAYLLAQAANLSQGLLATRFAGSKSAGGAVSDPVKNYYHIARWLVWAAEMYREHYTYSLQDLGYTQSTVKGGVRQSGTGAAIISGFRSRSKIANPPTEWRIYCAQWGVGIPGGSRASDYALFPDVVDGVHPNVVMERIMEQIPPPGALPSGSELAGGLLAQWHQDVYLRPNVGWFITLDQWKDHCRAERGGMPTWEKVWLGIVLTAVSAVSAYGMAAVGPALASGYGAVLGGAMSYGIRSLIDVAINFGVGGGVPSFKWGDVLEALSVASLEALNAADFSGSSLEDVYNQAVSYYEGIRETYDKVWGYGNDLMTGIEQEYLGFDLSDVVSDYA